MKGYIYIDLPHADARIRLPPSLKMLLMLEDSAVVSCLPRAASEIRHGHMSKYFVILLLQPGGLVYKFQHVQCNSDRMNIRNRD